MYAFYVSFCLTSQLTLTLEQYNSHFITLYITSTLHYTGASYASVQKCHCILQLCIFIIKCIYIHIQYSCQQCYDIIFTMQYFHYSLILCCVRISRFNLCQKQRSCLSSEICYHTHLSFFTFHRLNVSQISSRLGSLNYREQCQL